MQNIFLRMLLHKRKRSGGYVETWGVVLLEKYTSQTANYLIFTVLVFHILKL